MKIIHIILIILLSIIVTSCSNKKQQIQQTTTVKIVKDNYKKALSYEDKDGIIQGNNYSNYKYYLDRTIKNKNPKAYYKAFRDYKNPIGKRAYINNTYEIVANFDKQKATKFALLTIENPKDKEIACKTIKEVGNQYLFNKEQSYKIYLANKKQGCVYKKDKNFDFLFTPSVSFINKTIKNKAYMQKNREVQKDLIDSYAKKAIDGTLPKKYAKYDDRWIILSQSAINLALISEKEGDKESAGHYLALAKEIIMSTPLNKNRYLKYDFKNKGKKIYYHYKKRNEIIKTGTDKILRALLKII